MNKQIFSFFSAFMFLTIPSILFAQTEQSGSRNVVEMIKNVKPAIVQIVGITTDNKETRGTGFLVEEIGTIVTNFHIIHGLESASIHLSNGDIYDKVTILAVDERKDLAIIKIFGFDLPVLDLGNSNNVEVGEKAVLIGNPLGFELSATTGIISAIRSSGDGFQVIQTDAAANPGNSGGPLLNENGEVVGVLSFGIKEAENLNFAIPINYAKGLILSINNLEQQQGSIIENKDILQIGAPAFPSRWKSLASGTIKIIRVDGDYVYVETVLSDS